MDDQTPKPAIIQEGLTWKQLNQKHDCYDATRVNKLNLLLKGGYDITKKDNAKKNQGLMKMPEESRAYENARRIKDL